MPTPILKYRLFLSSPSDLLDDRASIEEVISELNLTFGHYNNLILELIKWETHSGPAISDKSVQKIITDNVGDNYDLFIGLLWKKFGTPTDQFDSGTEEEFISAHQKYLNKPSSLQILFYFKDAPILPSETDTTQLKRVQGFKRDIGEFKNVLYWEYQDTEQLGSFLRIHIRKRINDLIRIKDVSVIKLNSPDDETSFNSIEEELGIIDYQEMVEDYLADTTQALLRISDSTTSVGEQIVRKASEINALSLGGNRPSRKEIRDILVRTGKIMENSSNRIKPEIPIYQESFKKGIDAISKLIDISKSDLNPDETEIIEMKSSLAEMTNSIAHSIASMTGFLETVRQLPRLSKELNKAKLDMGETLENLLHNLTISQTIAQELSDNLK